MKLPTFKLSTYYWLGTLMFSLGLAFGTHEIAALPICMGIAIITYVVVIGLSESL